MIHREQSTFPPYYEQVAIDLKMRLNPSEVVKKQKQNTNPQKGTDVNSQGFFKVEGYTRLYERVAHAGCLFHISHASVVLIHFSAYSTWVWLCGFRQERGPPPHTQ